MPIADQFPAEWRISFQLACYFCKLGQKTEALKWLDRAIDVAGKTDIRLKALDEPYLEALWLNIADI